MLDTAGLEKFVLRTVPWGRIRVNLRARRLKALAVSATHVGSGHTTVFIDSADKVPDAWSRDPFVRHRISAVGPRHALASAAIPMLFPAVKLGRSFYVDGGLRQNTPMSPAIRLGAQRLLVISLRHLSQDHPDPVLEHDREVAYPKPLFLAGKALNALLLDRTDYDIERMLRLNAIIKAGTAAFGEKFKDVLNQELVKLRGAPIRPLDVVHVRPSVEIGGLAARFVEEGRTSVKGRVAKRLVARLANSEAEHESDLLSYLLFDGEFAGALVDIGFQDAKAMESELAQLFSRDYSDEERELEVGS
jgi:NTE family protein